MAYLRLNIPKRMKQPRQKKLKSLQPLKREIFRKRRLKRTRLLKMGQMQPSLKKTVIMKLSSIK